MINLDAIKEGVSWDIFPLQVCQVWSTVSSSMDYIKKFDIELEKEYYYAGEKVKGWVIVQNTENIKIRGKGLSNLMSSNLLIYRHSKGIQWCSD